MDSIPLISRWSDNVNRCSLPTVMLFRSWWSTAQIQRLLKLNWNSSRLQADLVIVAHRPNPASHKEEEKDYYIYRAHNSRWPVRLLELSDPIQSVLLLLFPLVITSAAVLPIIAWPHLSSKDIITLYVYIYTYRVAVGYTWPFFRTNSIRNANRFNCVSYYTTTKKNRFCPIRSTGFNIQNTLFRSYESRKWCRKPQRPIPEDDFI